MVAAVAAAIFVAGCVDKSEDEGPPRPQAAVFGGQVEPKFVGSWKTQNERSGLDLGKDGSLKILAVFASPHGDSTSILSGHWLVSDGNLILKYATTGQPETVLKYQTVLSGNTLTLTQGRIKTIYQRK